MKRVFSLILATLTVFSWAFFCPAVSVFAETKTQTVTLADFDAKLRLNVSAQLSGQTVLDAYQKAVLFSDRADLTGADGAPRGDESGQITVNAGERVKVYAQNSYLKIYTAVILQESASAADESTPLSQREVDYETRTLYLAPNTSFAVTRESAGLCIELFYGSIACAYTSDPFRSASIELRFPGAHVQIPEAYFAVGTDAAGVGFVHLGGNDPVVFEASNGAQMSLLQNDALRADSVGDPVFRALDPDELLAIGTGENEADSIRFSALLSAVKQHSAIADGLIKLLETLGDHKPDVNFYLNAWETALDTLECDFARQKTDTSAVPEILPLDAETFRSLFRPAGFEYALEAIGEFTPRLLRLPESAAGYTVTDAGKIVRISRFDADPALEFSVLPAIALSESGGSLIASFGEKSYDISRTDEEGLVWFSIPKTDLLQDPDAVLKLHYQTEKTFLSLPQSSASYTVEPSESAPVEVPAGEPYTVTVRLNRALGRAESFSAIHLSPDDEEGVTLQPQGLSGAANAYTFTLTPKAGFNALSLSYDAVFSLEFARELDSAYAARLTGTGSQTRLAADAPFAVRLTQTEPCELIPVVFLQDALSTRVLSDDGYGNYVCPGLYADSKLSVTLGFPVSLPEESPLYTVVPEEGYSAAYAREGSSYAFRVILSENAPLGTSLIVRDSGAILTPGADGVYRIEEVSAPINVQISTGVAFQVFLPTGDNYSASPYGGDSTTVVENGSFRFTLDVNPGVSSSQLIVAANNTVLTPQGGVYEITGINQDIYVTVRLISSFRVILPTGDGYNVFAYANSSTTVLSGGSFSFTIQTDASVREGSVLTVTANNTVLYPSGGVYTINNIQSDTYVTVSLRRMYAVHLPASGSRYTVSASTDSVLYGESFTFAISSVSGESLTVRANGVPLAGSGVYTIPNISCDQYVSVDGDDVSSYTVSLYGSATALSPANVPMGGSFSFSVIAESEPNIYLAGAAGAATLVQTIAGIDGTNTYLYQITGIYSNLTVNVS